MLAFNVNRLEMVVKRQEQTAAAVEARQARAATTDAVRRLEAVLTAVEQLPSDLASIPSVQAVELRARCVAALAEVRQAATTLRASDGRRLLGRVRKLFPQVRPEGWVRPAAEVERLVLAALRDDGLTVEAIGRLTGQSGAAVSQKLSKVG